MRYFSISPHVRPLFGWMVDRLVGRLAVQLVGWFIGWSVGWVVGLSYFLQKREVFFVIPYF